MDTNLAPLPRNLLLQLLTRGTRLRKVNLINQLEGAIRAEWVHTKGKAMSHWLHSELRQNGTRRARKLTWPSHCLKCFHMLFLQLQSLPWRNLHLLHGKSNMYQHRVSKDSSFVSRFCFVCSLSVAFFWVWVTSFISSFKHVCMCSKVHCKRLEFLLVIWELCLICPCSFAYWSYLNLLYRVSKDYYAPALGGIMLSIGVQLSVSDFALVLKRYLLYCVAIGLTLVFVHV